MNDRDVSNRSKMKQKEQTIKVKWFVSLFGIGNYV